MTFGARPACRADGTEEPRCFSRHQDGLAIAGHLAARHIAPPSCSWPVAMGRIVSQDLGAANPRILSPMVMRW